MLKSLYIRNYVLIDTLDINFDKNFSVITGETGAGKSIILGALSLISGQRADVKSIKAGADKCTIEGEFDISLYNNMEELFNRFELDYDPASCILRRDLYVSGKSRAFVNDSPVPLSVLKEIASQLIDIHSQHQNLLLGDNLFQLKVLDIVAGNSALLSEYQSVFSCYQKQRKQLEELKEKAERSKTEQDYLQYQLTQLADANLSEGEQVALEEEQEMLVHAEEIKGALYKIAGLLSNDETGGAVQLVKDASNMAGTAGKYYASANGIEERLRSIYIDLQDLSFEVESKKESIEFDPERLNWVNERLNLLYSLEQKHRVQTVEELIALQNELECKLAEINSFDTQITALENEIERLFGTVKEKAEALSDMRKQAAKLVSSELQKSIAPLGMPNIRFEIRVAPRLEPNLYGANDVSFFFSANKNIPLRPVAEIASGGEIARLMLCLKALIAGKTALPTIIFDEIDTGVSGDIADKMGDIMQELGKKMQVFAITHLPQIAAKGDSHFFVYKEDGDTETFTRIRKLNREERIREIARMLSGANLTQASIANAKELLDGRS